MAPSADPMITLRKKISSFGGNDRPKSFIVVSPTTKAIMLTLIEKIPG